MDRRPNSSNRGSEQRIEKRDGAFVKPTSKPCPGPPPKQPPKSK